MSDPQHTEETRTALPRASPAVPALRAGQKVGRFSILSEIGAGGMGRIFEAYDPNLDRRIALKLLRDSGEDGHWQRLVREAQALARLDHPNVVRVHDVGVHEGALFVAMEFVRGGTLKEWLSEHPVGDAERFETAIGLLVDAGRGLVAAHEAGLVHRDVKPSNILIGDDGRARMADFGIARALESTPRAKESDSVSSEEDILLSTDDSESSLTRTGVAVGTPAYMAPEQFGRGQVGPAADQFSFCVTAWEVLFGVRPFSGADRRARLAAVRRAEPNRPEGVEADADVVALLGRGLRYRASARHPRLEELVDALSLDSGSPSTRRSWWRWGAAIVGVGLLGAVGAHRTGQNRQLCTGATAAFEGVWGDEHRERVRAAMLGSGLEFAPGAWSRLEAGLERYGERWRDAHTEACEATRVREEQTPERMEETMACLDDAKRSVEALVTLASSGEPSVIANEHELLDGLPSIEGCAEVRGVPTTAELALLDAIATAGAQRSAGQPREALQVIEPIAEGLGDDTSPIVRARVLLEYGRGLSEGQGRKAIEVLSEAYSVAHGAGLGQLAAAAAREVAKQHALLLGKPGTVRTWLELAKSEGTGDSVSEKYELLMLEGMMLKLEGDREAATEAFERGVGVAKEDPALHPHALRYLGESLQHVDADRAAEVGRRALVLFRDEFGNQHPGLAVFERVQSGILGSVGEHERADELARRALRRAMGVWGQEHAATTRYLVRLAEVRCNVFGDRVEGRRLAERALRLLHLSEMTPERFDALSALEQCVRSHEPRRARQVAGQMLDLSRELHGDEHFRTAYVRAVYARALLQGSDVAGARKQVSLATRRGTQAGPRGWDGEVVRHFHGSLARSARLLQMDPISLQHGEAALRWNDRNSSGQLTDRLAVSSDLCFARRAVGDLDSALVHCLAALELSDESGPSLRVAALEYDVGELLHLLQRNHDALPHMERASRLFEDQTEEATYYVALAHLRLGLINEELGRFEEAEGHFQTSFAVLESVGGSNGLLIDSGTGVARTVARLGRVDEALALLDQLEVLAGVVIDIQHAQISESRGLIRSIQTPGDGVSEYSRAITFYRFAGHRHRAARACRHVPVPVPVCYASP